MIITIDGPTASGKSTVAKLLAQKLNFTYLNSGLLYRAVAYILVHFFKYDEKALENPNQNDLDQIVSQLVYQDSFEQPQILYADHNLTPYLKTGKMDHLSSISSAVPQVRSSLMTIQRQLAQKHNLIAEGRDTGTVVFPQAELKIFLTASLEVRARRWQNFMHKRGFIYTDAESLHLVDMRDQRDLQRTIAPMIPAVDAIIVDSSELDTAQVVAQICSYVK